MWKCHHCKTRPTWTWGGVSGKKGCGMQGGSAAASQKAIKICNHLFPLPHLIHLSGEWLCPYPPKATNLFSCLSPCIRMNLWNSQTCSLPPLPLPLLLLLLPSKPLLIFVSSLHPRLQLSHCLPILTFSSSHSVPAPVLPPPLRFAVSGTSAWIQFKSYPPRERATTRLCQWQFNPWWARCM